MMISTNGYSKAKRYPAAAPCREAARSAEPRPSTRGMLTVLAMLSVLVVALPSPAAAYIGPGAALSLLGAFWGVLVAVGAAVAFAVAWPVRRYLRMRRERKAGTDGESARTAESPARTTSVKSERTERAGRPAPYGATEA